MSMHHHNISTSQSGPVSRDGCGVCVSVCFTSGGRTTQTHTHTVRRSRSRRDTTSGSPLPDNFRIQTVPSQGRIAGEPTKWVRKISRSRARRSAGKGCRTASWSECEEAPPPLLRVLVPLLELVVRCRLGAGTVWGGEGSPPAASSDRWCCCPSVVSSSLSGVTTAGTTATDAGGAETGFAAALLLLLLLLLAAATTRVADGTTAPPPLAPPEGWSSWGRCWPGRR